jgi:hypothetical protein
MASPMVSDVRIDWGGSDVQTLAEIPPLFDGDAVAVYARSLGSPPKEVTLRCKLPDGAEAAWTLPVGHAIADVAGIVPTMWARRAIQSFEEVNGVRRTSALLKDQGRDRQRLLAISKDFNLVCSLTSFIAVEHRSIEERNEGRPAVRRVPVTMAKGWGAAAAAMAAGGGVRYCMSVDKSIDASVAKHRMSGSSGRSRFARRSVAPSQPPVGGGPGAPGGPEDGLLDLSRETDFRSELMELLACQAADGSFERLPADAVSITDAQRAELAKELAALAGSGMVPESVIRTGVALMTFRMAHAAEIASWRRAHGKACRWISMTLKVDVVAITALLERLERQWSSSPSRPVN